MAESMTSIEIEDVLSSIRRLVSEDLRPTHKLVSAALQNNASKLILTPALRVVSDIRAALPERDDTTDEPHDLETLLLEIQADGHPDAADIVPVFGSIRQQDAIDWAGQDQDVAAVIAPTDGNFLPTAMSRINVLASAVDNAAAQSQMDTIEAVVAVVGAAVGPEEWEPDGGEPAPQAKAWGDTVWNSAEADVLSLDGPSSVSGALAGDDVLPQQEAVLQNVENELPPDAVVPLPPLDLEGGVRADRIVFHDVASLGDAMAPAEAVEAQKDAEEDLSGILSEDLLREIVRDMIREELQGTLGERITRNVRKLVRAEISRALASRDFDDVASR